MHLSNMKANTGFEVEPPVVASELCLHRFPCSLIFNSHTLAMFMATLCSQVWFVPRGCKVTLRTDHAV